MPKKNQQSNGQDRSDEQQVIHGRNYHRRRFPHQTVWLFAICYEKKQKCVASVRTRRRNPFSVSTSFRCIPYVPLFHPNFFFSSSTFGLFLIVFMRRWAVGSRHAVNEWILGINKSDCSAVRKYICHLPFAMEGNNLLRDDWGLLKMNLFLYTWTKCKLNLVSCGIIRNYFEICHVRILLLFYLSKFTLI